MTEDDEEAERQFHAAVEHVMNAVVLPLSAIPFTPSYAPRSLVTGLGPRQEIIIQFEAVE